MNSLHDAVHSRNGPAEAAGNWERNARGDVELALLRCIGQGRWRPALSLTVALAPPKLELYLSEVTFIYLLQKII